MTIWSIIIRMNAPTGIDLANEVDSVIYKPDMNQGPRVLYANMTFGQGEQLTMIQVISAFCAAVINGGKYYQPTVVLGTLEGDSADQNVTCKGEGARLGGRECPEA